ncbi:MAG: hypothetical protein ACKPKO_31355, partial [Candidatus Fonsibacter sp.]
MDGIFQNNRRFCEIVKEEIVYDVGQAIVKSKAVGNGFLPERLEILLSVVVVGKRPIVRNKEIVLSMLKNPNYSTILHG